MRPSASLMTIPADSFLPAIGLMGGSSSPESWPGTSRHSEAVFGASSHGANGTPLIPSTMGESGTTVAHAWESVQADKAEGTDGSLMVTACPWSSDRKSTRLNSSHHSISYA